MFYLFIFFILCHIQTNDLDWKNTFGTFLTFTATRYLPPCMPHVGPLDPVTFKEATSSIKYGSIRPKSGVTPGFFYTLFCHAWVLWTQQHAKKPRLFIGYTGPLDPRRDFTIQKVRVANRNCEISNIVIS